MDTVGAARSWAIEELRRVRAESPELSADLLLGFVLGWTRVRVLSHPEQNLSGSAREHFRELVLRFAGGEPLQYLTGEQEFYGLPFRVTPEVLIPRPETELLVEEAIRLMKASPFPRPRFADMGTGSGCIAVSVAHAVPDSIGWAVDLSAAALRIARENAVRHGVAARISFVRADFLECFARRPCFDLILSNPPYVAQRDYDSLPPVVRNHEPHGALFAGDTGLEVYRRMIPEVPPRLAPGGYLILELGSGQADHVAGLAESEGFVVDRILEDLQGIPRCLVARKPSGRGHG